MESRFGHLPMKIGALAAAGALGGCVLSATQALAEPVDPYYTITNANSGKCLAIDGASTADGAVVVQQACYPSDDQRWYMHTSTGNTVRLINVKSGKCLAIGAAIMTDGQQAIQWSCLNGNEQRWIVGDVNGAKTLTADHSGKCLSIGASSVANGAAAIQFRCWGGADQGWYLNYHA